MGKNRMLRSLIMFFVFAFMVSVMGACSTSSNSSNGSENGARSEEKGGSLIIARLSDATRLDPHFITDIPSANIIYQKVYETLVVPNQDMEIEPLLATEWKQLDEITWEFSLKEGVKFHDGTPFNAEAVKVTFERVLDPETGSPQREKLSMIKEIEVLDEYTVRMHLDYPYAPLLSILASNEGSIISPKAIKENEESLSQHPVGTGPFIFESWNTGQDITLIKNPSYWGQEPNLEEVIFKVVPEDATRLALIETGEAHVSDQVPVTELDRIENSNSMSLYRTEGLGVEYIGFNVESKVVNDVRVRKAISHAIEREAILKGVYNKVGTLANSAMSPKVFGYSENIKAYEYDINKAKKFLKEAGYKDGLSLNLLTSDRKERINMAEVIQSQLKGIGVDVSIQVLEYGAYLEMIDKGDHDLFIGGWGNATGDGDYNQYNLFHTASQGPPGNHFYYSNEEVDNIIEKAREEMDQEKRKVLYEKAMQIQMDDAVYVPIRNYEHLAVYTKGVEGIWLNASNYIMLNDVTIK
ncbi:glutathione ABC transporter substrate-binding protein [Sutcliffiella horikoshii]|uniref:Glutathione ABC transporter substrate-binding protein n=1 Tax=Sutcliffiella horikoshii TaxID=79883 RepID=A0ABM6KGN7_9BACI|nr:glutathione ABC transporter substrate-binding protein [Sutcliffiella horikoshii]ART75511.1 glutathione ABC transporter substrate-binding protein [Sutcliffiella horikoshii]